MIMDVSPFHILAQGRFVIPTNLPDPEGDHPIQYKRVRWFYLKSISTGYSKRSCTFGNSGDVDGCGWLISGVDRYKWTLYSGKTPTKFTGPDRDHTTASEHGYYMYTKSLSESKYNDESNLHSGLIVPSLNQCLTFWYHMYGRDINTLKVFQNSSGHNKELWSKTGNQGNKWHVHSLPLINIGPYRINFKAIRGNGDRSNIAVDDIFIKNTVCNVNKVSRLDCNFEDDSCEWKSEPKAAYNWTIFSGKTPTSYSGPDVDHTSGTILPNTYAYQLTIVQKWRCSTVK
ncbi:hypothetical protein AM593_07550, partial [Mytilus galloprovincialis]